MKRPTFFNGVAVAVVLALVASAVVAVFVPFIGTTAVARIVIPGMGLAYILCLMARSGECVGRVTTLGLWSVMTLAAWWFAPSLPFYLLVHVGAIWLVRSLYFYSGVIPALGDMALTGLGVVTGAWALWRTGSVFLATWSFFLVQALFVAIPESIRKQPETAAGVESDDFDRARRRAEAAIRQLITH